MQASGEALGAERKLIFENVASGVPMPDIMAAFSRSEAEVLREVAFVGRKIREYRFRRHMPPLACEQLFDIRWNRRALLDTLRKLGPKYLSTELIIPNVGIQGIATVQDFKEAARETRVRVQ